MEQFFVLNQNVKIISDVSLPTVMYGINRLHRDLEMTLSKSDKKGNIIHLIQEEMEDECFHIHFINSEEMVIGSSTELGFIYALLHISEVYLNVTPFWFWNDQKFIKKEEVKIPLTNYRPLKAKVRFRGWFVNDEVLIDQWRVNDSSTLPWEMAFEALLRCGGNMVIPGTDKNSKKYKELATNMGLWITHHHAEPLGAEMFARKYPELNPSFGEYPELFYQLWNDGIEEQKNSNIIWNLGFRGQGDCPFWVNDPQYKTSESRGELISSIIKKQYDLVRSKVDNPICCTNLYGESMELYKEGFLSLPEDVIKIWADNGYGKMVSRRQDNNNPRVYALPDNGEGDDALNHKKECHGLYYHVSFYDLQAANHMTMQPNSLSFINSELKDAFSKGANDYLIVNCSNIKPHVYYLDAISKIWKDGEIDVREQGLDYVRTYYNHGSLDNSALVSDIYDCFDNYAKSTVSFGVHEDERAGEQFYNYTTRILASKWLKGQYTESAHGLNWATGDITFKEQVKWFLEKCQEGEKNFLRLLTQCENILPKLDESQKELFLDSIMLQVNLHLKCLQGSIAFCQSFNYFNENEYEKSFYLLGLAKESFQDANSSMREREHDKWDGFYANDCLCDIKQTAYVLGHIMAYVRNFGDGPHFFKWQREFMYKEEDKRVVLLTNTENHLTDEELFEGMKNNTMFSDM